VINNKIRNLHGKQKHQTNDLETLNIDTDDRRHVELHLVNKRESEENKTKERHKSKLDRLKTKQAVKCKAKDNTEPDLSGTQLKKWRENGSKTSPKKN
jgi:hypothetical protein